MCWLFHKWTKWEFYVQEYTTTARWGKLAGQSFDCNEKRQRRSCETCGKTQDEKIL